MNEDMSIEEAQQLIDKISGGGIAPLPEEKHNTHSFLHAVATSDDTTKVANLTAEEVGLAKLPVRTYKELALFCSEVANMDYMSDYFNKKAEIVNATSLAREGFLTRLAVMIRRESTDTIKSPSKPNSGWFKSKTKNQEGGV